MQLLTLLLPLVCVALDPVGGALDPGGAAFGVFGWLQVTDFDFGDFFCILVFLCWVVCCFCCVSDTEQQLMPARNVPFWNQVIQTNQSIFPALRPLIS